LLANSYISGPAFASIKRAAASRGLAVGSISNADAATLGKLSAADAIAAIEDERDRR
jgi:hypothetical protein